MKTYPIKGMHCDGCANTLTRILTKAGFQVTVNLQEHTASIEGTPDDAQVEAAVKRAGFQVAHDR